MELLALQKPIKKPPRSDERDGELFCGTPTITSNGVVYVGESPLSLTPTVDTIYCYFSLGGCRGTYLGRDIYYSTCGAASSSYRYCGCEIVKAGTTITFLNNSSGYFIFKAELQ